MSMADRDGKIWKGRQADRLARCADPRPDPHPATTAWAFSRGVRAYKTADGTAIFRLAEHTRRLFNSAKIFQMEIPSTSRRSATPSSKSLRANQLESCYLRPIAWIGSEKLGVSAKGNTVHVAIAAWPWGAYLGEDGLAKGIRVKTSSFTRHHVNISMVRAKASAWYVNSILATRKRPPTAMTRRCCSTSTATSRKARAKTSSS